MNEIRVKQFLETRKVAVLTGLAIGLNELKQLLLDAVNNGVSEHFAKAMSKKSFDKNDVEAGREFVKAYVEYIHCVEAIYQRATKPVHGHYPEEDDIPHAHEK